MSIVGIDGVYSEASGKTATAWTRSRHARLVFVKPLLGESQIWKGS